MRDFPVLFLAMAEAGGRPGILCLLCALPALYWRACVTQAWPLSPADLSGYGTLAFFALVGPFSTGVSDPPALGGSAMTVHSMAICQPTDDAPTPATHHPRNGHSQCDHPPQAPTFSMSRALEVPHASCSFPTAAVVPRDKIPILGTSHRRDRKLDISDSLQLRLS
jgi:hypothetical protein